MISNNKFQKSPPKTTINIQILYLTMGNQSSHIDYEPLTFDARADHLSGRDRMAYDRTYEIYNSRILDSMEKCKKNKKPFQVNISTLDKVDEMCLKNVLSDISDATHYRFSVIVKDREQYKKSIITFSNS